MTAIQTKFNGRHYRSRLEARYAVLLHLCGMPFHYEREGFDLEQGRYLPDFWLPTLRLWLEVKGFPPSNREKDLCQTLADETELRVVIACGEPDMETIVGCFSPDCPRISIQTLSAFLMQWVSPEAVFRAIETVQSCRFEHGESPKVLPFARRAS